MSTSSKQRTSDIWDRLELIVRWRKSFTIFMIFIMIAGLSHALLAKLWYRSEAVVLPPTSNQMGLSSLLPALGSAAVAFGGALGNEPVLVMSILESQRMKDLVIEKFDWMNRYELKNLKAANKRFDKNFRWELGEEGFFRLIILEEDPEDAAKTVNFIVDETNKLYTEITIAQAKSQKHYIEKRLDKSYADLEAAENAMTQFQEKTGFVLPEEQIKASVTVLAELYTMLATQEVQLEVARNTLPEGSVDINLANENVKALKDKIAAMNNSSEKEVQDYLISMDMAPEAGVQFFRLQREIELQGLILEFLLPQYEQVRIQEYRDNTSLYILDRGKVPEKKHKPRRSLLVLAWVFLGFIFFYYYAFSVEKLAYLDENDPERSAKIRYVLDHIKPLRWFRFSRD